MATWMVWTFRPSWTCCLFLDLFTVARGQYAIRPRLPLICRVIRHLIARRPGRIRPGRISVVCRTLRNGLDVRVLRERWLLVSPAEQLLRRREASWGGSCRQILGPRNTKRIRGGRSAYQALDRVAQLQRNSTIAARRFGRRLLCVAIQSPRQITFKRRAGSRRRLRSRVIWVTPVRLPAFAEVVACTCEGKSSPPHGRGPRRLATTGDVS